MAALAAEKTSDNIIWPTRPALVDHSRPEVDVPEGRKLPVEAKALLSRIRR